MGAHIILCDGFEVVPPPDMNQSVSDCEELTVTNEEDDIFFSGGSSPGGAAEEEWPRATPFSFYVVKQRLYDDPEIKAKIDEADQEIYRCNILRVNVSNALKSERAEISSLNAQMEGLVPKSEGYKMVFEEKKREFDTLQEALRNLRCSSSDQLCFSKEELDHLIYIAHYQIEHGTNGLEGEDWVVKDTEKPDGIILSEESLAQKEASIRHVKSMAVELNEVKKELNALTWKVNYLTDKIGKSQNKIEVLGVEMAHILEKRDRFYGRIKMLRKHRDKGNAAHFQSLAILKKAKELAASKNVVDLEVLASSEVDKFMTHWNNDKAFRDDYVKRISLSLCKRQLSQDGRIKDPEVQVVQVKQAPYKTTKEGDAVQKTNREDSSSNSSRDGNAITNDQKKEERKNAEESDVIDLEFQVYEKPKKEEEEVDEETLKERKREEQLEKTRLAMERKRKMQEKAAAKAAIRAQKEAEKKLKECEKKAKKKAAANSSAPSESDKSQEVTKELEKVKNVAVSGKEKHQRSLFPKQRSFRCKHHGRGTEAIPKAILNRRKARKYWTWGVSSAALACALFLLVLLLK